VIASDGTKISTGCWTNPHPACSAAVVPAAEQRWMLVAIAIGAEFIFTLPLFISCR
jgi:hypothetical protein